MESDPYILENYNILKSLGKGGQGSVLLVTKKQKGEKKESKKIALKKILVVPKNDEKLEYAIEKALLEIRILEKISKPFCNPYISCYYDHYVNYKDGIIYIEMEYIEGPTFDEYRKQLFNRLPLDLDYIAGQIYKIIKNIVLALQTIHKNGILHLDVKPQNIIISEKDGAKLVDFGMSCFAIPADNSICTLPYNKIIGECCKDGGGTLLYVAPERLLKNIRYPQSDIWSFGATLYTVFEDRLIWPIKPTKMTEYYYYAASNLTPRQLDTGIQPLDDIINGMTRKKIEERLTIDEILKKLDNVPFVY